MSDDQPDPPPQVFEVEKIIDHKNEDGELIFKVKWLGFPDEDNTWEPLYNLQNCNKLIEEYMKSFDHSAESSHATSFYDAQQYPNAVLKIEPNDLIDPAEISDPFSFRKYSVPEKPLFGKLLGFKKHDGQTWMVFEGLENPLERRELLYDIGAVLFPHVIIELADKNIPKLLEKLKSSST
jgi:hypothetical protein